MTYVEYYRQIEEILTEALRELLPSDFAKLLNDVATLPDTFWVDDDTLPEDDEE